MASREPARATALAAGLASTMLVGGRTAADALAVIDYQIDRLFTGR